MSRHRGAGSIYKQPGCSTYTIKFYRGGRPIREATGLTDYQAARQKLNQRLNQVAEGTFAGLQMERTRVEELAENFLRDYRVNGRRVWTMQRHAGICISNPFSKRFGQWM